MLRRAVELGVNFIDTADSYGPFVSEELIREALHPYPDDLVIATKAGLLRTGPGPMGAARPPGYLRQQVEMSLRRLGVDRIDLFQLHRIDGKVPLEDQLGELAALQQEGKIRHIGLSEVSVEQLRGRAEDRADRRRCRTCYNLADRAAERGARGTARREGIGFIPWFPLATGALAGGGRPAGADSPREHGAPPRRSSRWPGCSPLAGDAADPRHVEGGHLEENVAAAEITLTDEEFETLSKAGAESG